MKGRERQIVRSLVFVDGLDVLQEQTPQWFESHGIRELNTITEIEDRDMGPGEIVSHLGDRIIHVTVIVMSQDDHHAHQLWKRLIADRQFSGWALQQILCLFDLGR